MANYPVPQPLFDTFNEFESSHQQSKEKPFATKDFKSSQEFLKQFSGNKTTFESYRREIERLIQWAWYVANKSILSSNGAWWFKIVGKGNKMRNIAVSDDMLASLKRYRKNMGLPPLPSSNEKTPLLPKEKGKGPMTSSRHIRRLVQNCFDKTIYKLRETGFFTDADALESATVHWLRHTGISDDINKRGRPVAHVRDDAGHSSSAITDRYNDIELIERYQSAKNKKINYRKLNKPQNKSQ